MKRIVLLVLLLFVSGAQAYTLDSSSATPNNIFKCQQSTILANFSDYTNIVSVQAIFLNQNIIENGLYVSNTTTSYMTNNGGGQWRTLFGNDPNMYWGMRTIFLNVTDNIESKIVSTNTQVFVYRDDCVGSNISNYTKINTGLGKYTNMLYNGNFSFFSTTLDRSIIGWAIYPWVQYWGYLFYVLVMFSITTTIYLKTESVIQPLLNGILILMVLVSTSTIDYQYRQWIIFIMAIAIAAIYYRIFVRN